jgi:hypothetical protein
MFSIAEGKGWGHTNIEGKGWGIQTLEDIQVDNFVIWLCGQLQQSIS